VSEPARDAAPIYTVGALLAGLRSLVEERVGRLWVVGEVSNLRRAGSGHVYFTLKDDAGQVRAALFRSAARRLLFEPEDGLEVLVYGDITIYEPRGDLQIIVRHVEPRGDGALRVAFEQLRRRLEAEGLFEAARKRELPELPRCIGVVTSPTSAAIRDVLEVTGRRCPALPVRIAATRVQGEGAERDVAAALDALGARGDVDVILLVRGGGSLEDLHAFNSEAVARAIARAPVPVVCGVGHEVDVTIADLAADRRAPTPSAAAELAAPDRQALRRTLERDWSRLCRAATARLERGATQLARERDAVAMLAPTARLAAQRTRLAALGRALRRAGAAAAAERRACLRALGPALVRAAQARTARERAGLGEAAARLETLSPLAVLARGYALVRRIRDGVLVRRADQLAPGERIAVRLAEARLEATVETLSSSADG
jgi:exodeoxyribonuclease VII large subunit